MTTVNEHEDSTDEAPQRRKVALRPNPRLVGDYEGNKRAIKAARRRIEEQLEASREADARAAREHSAHG